MRRALGPLVVALAVLATACAGRANPASSSGTGSGGAASGEPSGACRGAAAPVLVDPSPVLPSVEPPWGATISSVEVIGASHIPSELARAAVRVSAGSMLDSDAVARDVRALLELEAIETVRVDTERLNAGERVVLRYVIKERRVVGDVSYRWPRPLLAGHWVPLARGELYDPARVARMRTDLERNLVEEGYARAKVEERQEAKGTDRVDVCFLVDAGPRFVIDRISFAENERVAQAELTSLIRSHRDRANQAGKPYREDLLELDLLLVSALYYDRGYLDAKVGPARTTTRLEPAAANGHITVEIPVHEGPMYRIRQLRFAGSGNGATAEYARRLGIKSGDVFNRAKVMEGMASIRELHQRRGEVVEITPEAILDPARAQVDLTFDVKPSKPSGIKK